MSLLFEARYVIIATTHYWPSSTASSHHQAPMIERFGAIHIPCKTRSIAALAHHHEVLASCTLSLIISRHATNHLDCIESEVIWHSPIDGLSDGKV